MSIFGLTDDESDSLSLSLSNLLLVQIGHVYMYEKIMPCKGIAVTKIGIRQRRLRL